MKALTRKHWTYVAKSDEALPEAERTIWHCKLINKTLYAEVMEAADKAGALNFSGRITNRILEAALIGWENFIDPDTDQPIPFPAKVTEAVELIPGAIRAEIASEILSRTSLSEEQRKN